MKKSPIFMGSIALVVSFSALSADCNDYSYIGTKDYSGGKPLFFDRQSLLYKNTSDDEMSSLVHLLSALPDSDQGPEDLIELVRSGNYPSQTIIGDLTLNAMDLLVLSNADEKYLAEASEMGFSISNTTLAQLLLDAEPAKFVEYFEKFYEGDPSNIEVVIDDKPYSFFNALLNSHKYSHIDYYFANSELTYLIQSDIYKKTLVDISRFDIEILHWLSKYVDIRAYQKQFKENTELAQIAYAKEQNLLEEYSQYYLFSDCENTTETIKEEIKNLPKRSELLNEFETKNLVIGDITWNQLNSAGLSPHAQQLGLATLKRRLKKNAKLEIINGSFSDNIVYDEVTTKVKVNPDTIYIDDTGLTIDEYQLLNGIARKSDRLFPFVDLSNIAFYVVRNSPLTQNLLHNVTNPELNSIIQYTRNFSFYVHRLSLSKSKRDYFKKRLPQPKNQIGVEIQLPH